MDTLGLSLRQKKLLHFLRGSQTFTTGNALARQLGVSSRTIRSDVAEINAGQMVEDVRLSVNGAVPVAHFGRLGGIVPEPEEIVNEIKKM